MHRIEEYRLNKDLFSPEQIATLDRYIANSVEVPNSGFQFNKEDRVYLLRPETHTLNIWGIGDRNAKKLDGAIWGADEKGLLEALYYAKIENFFPYNVETGTFYLINKNQVYLADSYNKGATVDTPLGKGTVWSIEEDAVFCVELANDKSVLHEFNMDEITI